jgi:hypothetical protein
MQFNLLIFCLICDSFYHMSVCSHYQNVFEEVKALKQEGIVTECCWCNRERAIDGVSYGRLGNVRLKFHCQLPYGEPVDIQ